MRKSLAVVCVLSMFLAGCFLNENKLVDFPDIDAFNLMAFEGRGLTAEELDEYGGNMPDGTFIYTREDERVAGSAGFIYPLMNFYEMTSAYGPRSFDNHTGVDFGCPNKTPVIAAASGKVTAKGIQGGTGYGNRIIISHEVNGAKYSTLYAHLFECEVEVGDNVTQGQQIALSGFTGEVIPRSEAGAHLHFEVRRENSDGRFTHLEPYEFIGREFNNLAAESGGRKWKKRPPPSE